MKWLDEQIDKLLKARITRQSTSPWSSLVVLVSKKDGGLRLCIGFSNLNSVTAQ